LVKQIKLLKKMVYLLPSEKNKVMVKNWKIKVMVKVKVKDVVRAIFSKIDIHRFLHILYFLYRYRTTRLIDQDAAQEQSKIG
jgi:hypothetical protein